MKNELIIERIYQLTVPSSDDGKKFIRRNRLDMIIQALEDSTYHRLGEMPLAKVYCHEDFKPDSPTILISCHIDSLYDDYFALMKDGELQGTFDNSACNAIILEELLHSLLPAQALISFTGDEERNSRGVDQTIEILQNEDVFDDLEIVITLDLTEECYRAHDYTIENYFVEQNNSRSLFKFCRKQDLKNYLRSILDSPVFINDAEEDESWQYDEYDLNCFSLCLPCRLLGSDMHDLAGVAINPNSLEVYAQALQKLTHKITQDLANLSIRTDSRTSYR